VKNEKRRDEVRFLAGLHLQRSEEGKGVLGGVFQKGKGHIEGRADKGGNADIFMDQYMTLRVLLEGEK